MAALIDIGVNLTSPRFAEDLDALMQRARAQGVTHMVLIGSDLEDSRRALALCHRFPQCLATAGIHPHQAKTYDAPVLAALEELLSDSKVCAIGETGLDFNRNYSKPEQQLEAFEAQLQLAARTNLPLYLHQRDAHADFIELLRHYRSRISKAVVHCFTGDAAELEDYLALDLHIGITGWICDARRGYHLHPLLERIPRDRLLLETDAPYLLPRNMEARPKSSRNEPALLPYVLKMVATILALPPEEVAAFTSANAATFFGFPAMEA